MAKVGKPSMPSHTRQKAEAAIERHKQRQATPGVEVAGGWRDWSYGNPYRESDADRWAALVFDAFGTASQSAARVFLDQLANLVANDYDKGATDWRPNLDELNAAIAIVASAKPENELQAAIAAQMVALHFTSMGLARRLSDQAAPDERTAATLARVAKAYADLATRLAKLQGKLAPQTFNQNVNVFYYDNRQQLSMGGLGDFGGRAQAARENPIDQLSGCGRDERRAALPSTLQVNGCGMPSASGEGQAGLPRAWWGARVWRAIREG